MNHTKVPVTVMGGIGSDDDFIDLFEKHKIIGASAEVILYLKVNIELY